MPTIEKFPKANAASLYQYCFSKLSKKSSYKEYLIKNKRKNYSIFYQHNLCQLGEQMLQKLLILSFFCTNSIYASTISHPTCLLHTTHSWEGSEYIPFKEKLKTKGYNLLENSTDLIRENLDENHLIMEVKDDWTFGKFFSPHIRMVMLTIKRTLKHEEGWGIKGISLFSGSSSQYFWRNVARGNRAYVNAIKDLDKCVIEK